MSKEEKPKRPGSTPEQVPPLKAPNSKGLTQKTGLQVRPPKPEQLLLDLGIEVERDVNGIVMGVLENGIPYLTQSGLAQVLGVSTTAIRKLNAEWVEAVNNNHWKAGRLTFLSERLSEQGYDAQNLYIQVNKDNSAHHAYPDVVCTALLEYYAFEGNQKSDVALVNYRNFARIGFQNFIYDATGYKPADSWRYFQDRTSLLKDASPSGHFIIYNEITPLIVDLINSGLPVNDKIIPDISVGIAWAAYWNEEGLEAFHGRRTEYPHNYPEYYPQAKSNPQVAKAYPDSALPTFRRWFKEEYLPTKFPKYILNKAPKLKGGKPQAKQIASLYDSKQIEGPA